LIFGCIQVDEQIDNFIENLGNPRIRAIDLIDTDNRG
jgi:hypothetical protein